MSKYAVNQHSKNTNYSAFARLTGLAVGTATLAFVAANVGLVTSTVNGGQPQAQVAAKGGTSGGGGGTVAPVTVPATWPASVPTPTGTLTGTNSSTPNSWTLQYRMDTGYTQAMQAVETLYLSNGFTKAGDTAVYSNDAYQITVVGTNVDHSPTRTDVVIWLTAK